MKIVIEGHEEKHQIDPNTTRVDRYFRVRYKYRWWTPWRYIERQYAHSDPETKDFSTKEEAVSAARSLRQEYVGPKHTVNLLDEDGESLYKYGGL